MKTTAKLFLVALFFLITTVLAANPSFSQDKGSSKADTAQSKAAVKNPKTQETNKVSADPNQKVATVNGTAILRKDLNRTIESITTQNGMKGQLDQASIKDIETQALDHVVTMEVLRQECKRLRIDIPDSAVDERIAQIKTSFPGEKEFEETLKKSNLTLATLKDQLRQDLAIRELIDKEVADKVQVKEKESKAYYDSHPDTFKHPEQVKASHILVRLEKEDDETKKAAARKKIEDLQAKLKAGADFETLAKENSDCPSRSNGGDLGYFDRNALVKPFSDVAFSLKPGEISGIVETQFGYHLIKVVDKKPAGMQAYGDVKDKITGYLKQTTVQAKVREYIDDLKKHAQIDKFI